MITASRESNRRRQPKQVGLPGTLRSRNWRALRLPVWAAKRGPQSKKPQSHQLRLLPQGAPGVQARVFSDRAKCSGMFVRWSTWGLTGQSIGCFAPLISGVKRCRGYQLGRQSTAVPSEPRYPTLALFNDTHTCFSHACVQGFLNVYLSVIELMCTYRAEYFS